MPKKRTIPNRARFLPALVLWSLFGCGESTDVATGALAANPAEEAADPITVAVDRVVRGAMASSYSTSATLRAERSATVTSRTRGVLEELLVEEGDSVETGQTLARLEDDEQALAVARYESVHEIKTRELERLTGLNEQAIVSDSELEIIRREVREASNDLELARLNLARTTIESPFDGIVVLRYLDVGATVSDGVPVFDLADVDPLYIDVRIPERHVARLAKDQTVRVDADALESSVEARIERLAPVVDAATGTVKVTVAVERAVSLRPGAFVEIEIVTDVHEDTLVIPRSALVAEGRRWLVYRIREDGASVEAVEVSLGYEEGDRVEVFDSVGEKKLGAGDSLVVLGASALSDGAPVEIMERQTEVAVDEEDEFAATSNPK